MPSGIHPAEVVRGAGRSHNGTDFSLEAVEGRKAGQPLGDGRHGLGDEVDDDVAVAVLRLSAVGTCDDWRDTGDGVNVLLVPCDHLVA